MNGYVKPVYSPAQVDAAGSLLADGAVDTQAYLPVIYNWRAAHARHLNGLHRTLERRAQKIVRTALVVQRLKPLRAIRRKLVDEPRVTLSELGDLAACRAIVPTQEHAQLLRKYFAMAPLSHPLERCDDLVVHPSAAGERAIHLHYHIAGMRVELQIRTRLQHLWSCAVEAVQLLNGQDLKQHRGGAPWRRFFFLMSAVFAHQDQGPGAIAPSVQLHGWHDEIRQLDEMYHLSAQLAQFLKLAVLVEQQRDARYFLVRSDAGSATVRVHGFNLHGLPQALARYAEIECMHGTDAGHSVVLVAAASLAQLERAYPHCCMSVAAFLTQVASITGVFRWRAKGAQEPRP